MFNQSIDKKFFGYILAVLMIAETVSLACYALPMLNWAVLVILLIGISWLYYHDRRWLVYLPVLEVFWGSLGRAWYWEMGSFSLSIRMVIFGLTILWWLPHSYHSLKQIDWNQWMSRLYLAVIFFLLTSTVLGIWHHNTLSTIFFDGNGYSFWLYYIIWYPLVGQINWKKLASILLASAVIISAKTLVIFHLFTHLYDWANITFLYLWVRDTKVGELTLVTANYWRVFFQSQLFPAIVWLMAMVSLIRSPKIRWSWKEVSLIALMLTAVLISLSRSFWLALLVSLVIFKILNLKKLFQLPQKKLRLGIFFSSLILALMIIAGTLFIPPVDSELASAFANRFSSGESAASSRANLIPVMIHGIQQNWLLGSGLGSTLTYTNNDPRIRSLLNPDGSYSTYAFELGWLDIWFKFGLLGLLAWVALIGYCLYQGWRASKRDPDHAVQLLALTVSLGFIAITHAITPYLNHPLGLSFLILTMLCLQHYESKKTTSHH
jgi:O-antigen ligase